MAEELDGNKELLKVFGYLVIVGLGWILPAPEPITPIGVKVFLFFWQWFTAGR